MSAKAPGGPVTATKATTTAVHSAGSTGPGAASNGSPGATSLSPAEAFAGAHQAAADPAHPRTAQPTLGGTEEIDPVRAAVSVPIALGAATVSSLGGTGALLAGLVLAGGSVLILLGTRRGRTRRLG